MEDFEQTNRLSMMLGLGFSPEDPWRLRGKITDPQRSPGKRKLDMKRKTRNRTTRKSRQVNIHHPNKGTHH